MRDVVIVAGCRTPIGTIGGQFKTITSLDLSIPVMQELVKRAGIDPAMRIVLRCRRYSGWSS